MNLAVTKTISLLLLILIGFFLQKRIINKEQKTGIKEIILSVALPAIIFISLQKVNFEAEMIILPIMAIIFNLAMFLLKAFNQGAQSLNLCSMNFNHALRLCLDRWELLLFLVVIPCS